MPPSPHTSPQPALLPSPFTHSDEAIDKSPTFRGSSIPPPPIEATTASIYDSDPPPQTQAEADEGEDGEEDDDEEEDDDDYPPLAEEGAEGGASLLPPPEFHPFFTLVNDTATGETYHPHTYYIFSDDDPDVLTSASLQALDSYSPQSPLLAPHRPNAAAPTPTQQPSERFILLDLSHTGTAIDNATSLSPAWAVTDVVVRGAPTFQDEGVGSEGLMVVVEGVGAQQRTEEAGRAKDKMEEARKKSGGSLVMGMESLRVGMEGGLGVLEKIVGVD